ncbi:MAG: serine/threonine-protein kinase [Gemmataceae bacterium]
MLVGQQFGPFLIDKELGAGAMGAVYRGKYQKTGQVMAIKVMAPGIGSTNAAAADRFQREVDILKQLKHPNIVRLFGVGKHQNAPYYAMEYVEGESLDRVMARRDRMSWEEVVDLASQLCAALQHAHQAGIVHRDLKPSNLMMLSDGTLKLTDFGIAKDLDETQLTSTNCTVGTAAYMSPEQCRGERNITAKSDLYSLGIVLFELLTGRKPFISEVPMEMFLKHVNEIPPRPSKFALDIPVWLDNLVCQLLEKKPEHRPLNAQMVADVLHNIKEKVEAQASAGMDLASARGGDLRSRQGELDQEDRDAARALRGKKGRRKKKVVPWHQQIWLRALGILVVLAFVVGCIIVLLQPPSPASLHRQAERLMQSDNPERHDQAREGPIREYLARYGSRDDAMTEQVRRWAEDYDSARYEKLIERHLRYVREKKGLPVEAQSGSEELAFKAAQAESEGNGDEATTLWKQVLEREGPTGIGVVSRRHLEALAALPEELRRFDSLQRDVRTYRNEPQLDPLPAMAFNAYRREKLGDRVGARRAYERLLEDARKDPTARIWILMAGTRGKELKNSLVERPQDDKARAALLLRRLDEARSDRKMAVLDKRLLAHEVVLLYGRDDEFADVVKTARQMLADYDGILGKAATP